MQPILYTPMPLLPRKKSLYTTVDLRVIITRHLLLPVKVNHLELLFLLDTGASTTCIEQQTAETLRLVLQKNSELITSATETQTDGFSEAKIDVLQIGNICLNQQLLAVLNFEHINQRLEDVAGVRVQGIFGADLLLALKAVIDVGQAKLYLKEQ